MIKHLFLPVLLFFGLVGCKKSVETSEVLHTISRINWYTYTSTNSNLPENFVTNIEINNVNEIWVGTFSKGVAKFDGINWQVYNTKNSGLSNDTIWDMTVDNQNNLWVGTSNGLSRFDGTTWTVYNWTNAPLPTRNITSVAVDDNNIVWVGCGNSIEGGLLKFDGFTWQLFTPQNSILPCRIIDKIFIDNKNNKWIATNQYQGNGGVLKINNENWSLFNKNNTIMPYNSSDDISQDKNGNIWVAMAALLYDKPNYFDGSLAKYDWNSWKEFKTHEEIPKLTNRINCIRADKFNNIWAATMPEGFPSFGEYEIAMFNGLKWSVLSDIDNTFPHSFIMDMDFDKNHNLWIAQSDIGLTKVEIEMK